MKTSVLKMTGRSIKTFFGRYIALTLIVFLSIGFFSGLKVTTNSMVHTCEEYLTEQCFYDYRLISTIGFDKSAPEEFLQLPYVKYAEGSKSADVLISIEGNSEAYKVISLPERINLPSLVSGRLPEAENECIADAEDFDGMEIGDKIKIVSEDNSLGYTELVIVGFADSPLYLNLDRGSTAIGNGDLKGFVYVTDGTFAIDYYTDVYVTLRETAPIYSDEYDSLIYEYKDEILSVGERAADGRYKKILDQMGILEVFAPVFGLPAPTVYSLTRNENAGYVSFESDSAILGGVANIFPVFFILIALLVCMTTMTRMVDEERTQMGVLKAIGFSDGAILAKYLIYAGSATLIGWAAGFFLGTWLLPELFWFVFGAIYGFTSLRYMFSSFYALLTLAVSLIGILGSTAYCCMRELKREPAALIRPKPLKNGKRILLERFTPFWKRLSFLQKVNFRNMFRYKPRLLMMLLGVGCCTALLVTAFGIKDSVLNIADLQYGGVQQFQLEITFNGKDAEIVDDKLGKTDSIDDYMLVFSTAVDLYSDEGTWSSTLITFDTDMPDGFWQLTLNGEKTELPKRGEILVCRRIASDLGLSVGDTVEVRDAEFRSVFLTVGGVYENYVKTNVIMRSDTYSDSFGVWEPNTAFIKTEEDISMLSEELLSTPEVIGAIRISDFYDGVSNGLSCINYIIWVVVAFAGALAFIVIYNLTNINLAERSREVATVEVLGFYPREVHAYVLRENIIMSVAAAVLGLPLGKLFHMLVMSMIKIELITFPTRIYAVSYIISAILTVVFAMLINQYMKLHISKIEMAQSLKTVE